MQNSTIIAHSVSIKRQGNCAKSQPDYETKSSYKVTIISKDEGGKSFSETFSLTVTDASNYLTLTIPTQATITEDANTSTSTGTIRSEWYSII